MPDDLLPPDVPLPVYADLKLGMIPVADFVEAVLMKMSWVDRKPGFQSSTQKLDESNWKPDVEKSVSLDFRSGPGNHGFAEYVVFALDYFD